MILRGLAHEGQTRTKTARKRQPVFLSIARSCRKAHCTFNQKLPPVDKTFSCRCRQHLHHEPSPCPLHPEDQARRSRTSPQRTGYCYSIPNTAPRLSRSMPGSRHRRQGSPADRTQRHQAVAKDAIPGAPCGDRKRSPGNSTGHREPARKPHRPGLPDRPLRAARNRPADRLQKKRYRFLPFRLTEQKSCR